jgi:tetratricopeptide (TPR) repeat protein
LLRQEEAAATPTITVGVAAKALEAARQAASHQTMFEALLLRSIAHTYTLGIPEAIACAEELLSGASRVHATRYEASAHASLSRAKLLGGDVEQAFDHANTSVKLLRQLSDPIHLNIAMTAQADSLRRLGRSEEAMIGYLEAFQLAQDANSYEGRINVLLGMAALSQSCGDLDSAIQQVNQAFEVSSQRNICLLQGFSLALLASIEHDRQEYESSHVNAAKAKESLGEARHHPAVSA